MLAAGPDAITCDQIARGTPLSEARNDSGGRTGGRPAAQGSRRDRPPHVAAAAGLLPIILFQSLSAVAAVAAAAAASDAEKETRKVVQ